jgi:copper(I)-binding protein
MSNLFRLMTTVLFLPASLLLAACGSPEPAPAPLPKADITITDAWARPAAMVKEESSGMDGMSSMDASTSMAGMSHGGGSGAAYFTMTNAGDAADTLVEVLDARIDAPGDVAGVVELHETAMADGVMAMHRVSGFEVPAGETVHLKPGGYHVMLLQLKRDLVAGDRLTLDLRFASGEVQTVVAEVRQP